eukprot:evm.model.scf_895.3 EVM.evm.TU.scf_895.3   scf_895:21051-22778(-)
MEGVGEAFHKAPGVLSASQVQDAPLLKAQDAHSPYKMAVGEHGSPRSPAYSDSGCNTVADSAVHGSHGFTADPYQVVANPIYVLQHQPIVHQTQPEKCWNVYWLLYVLGWVLLLPPIWIGGAFGICSKKEGEKMAGWVSLVTFIIITITVIVPAILVIVIAVDSPFDDDGVE